MPFSNILHPITKKEYKVTSIHGLEILNNYLLQVMQQTATAGGKKNKNKTMKRSKKKPQYTYI
jgi:hypothetical protein